MGNERSRSKPRKDFGMIRSMGFLSGMFGLVSGRRLREIERRVESVEKRIIANSGFWDPLWYVRTYGYDLSCPKALDQWYREGWRKGEDPSPRFSVSESLPYVPKGVNPLLAFLNPWEKFPIPPRRGNVPKGPSDVCRVEGYRRQQLLRRPRGVIYTCVTGGYDDLQGIASYGYIAPEWDYVCVTDDPALVAAGRMGIWDVRPLTFSELDGARNNRWHKTHPHVIFPDAQESIYIDANIDILSPALFADIDRIGGDFVLPRHFKNQCVRSEFADVLKWDLDNRETVERQRRMVEESGMPRNYGQTENNVIYRRHNEPGIVDLDEEWWRMIRDHSKRDQLSLSWLLWRRGWRIEDMTFENTRLRPRDFFVFAHKGTPRCKY